VPGETMLWRRVILPLSLVAHSAALASGVGKASPVLQSSAQLPGLLSPQSQTQQAVEAPRALLAPRALAPSTTIRGLIPTMMASPETEVPAANPVDVDGTRLQGAMLMLAVAMLWGTNFPAVKASIEAGLPASVAAAMRFCIAAAALSPLLRDLRSLPRDLIAGGLECGCWIALGYIAQALALQDLQAGAVAFIASLQVVFVPLVLTAMGGNFTPRLALAALLCVGGVGLLELGGLSGQAVAGNANGAGDTLASLLALLQPVGFGTSYLRIEALMRKYPDAGLKISALQLISNALIAVAWLGSDLMASGGSLDVSALSEPSVVGGVLYTGLISTALTVLLQTQALGMLPATDSSVIVATEPLWAAGFASLLLGEVLGTSAQLGGLLILLGCLSNTVFPEGLGMGAAVEDNGERPLSSSSHGREERVGHEECTAGWKVAPLSHRRQAGGETNFAGSENVVRTRKPRPLSK